MLQVEMGKLNRLELAIHDAIVTAVEKERNLTITKAAEICGVSPSKISKFAKKMGFGGYKDYINFICGKERTGKKPKEKSDEIVRIKDFVHDFDMDVVDKLFNLIGRYDRIILFGYGPSFLCAQYFEYKLKIITQKYIITANEEGMVKNLINEESLLIVFSTTGKFRSFADIFGLAKEKKAGCVLIVEEYNTELLNAGDNVIFLTSSFQSNDLEPYLKSRSIFFILIEVLMQRLIKAYARTT